MIAQTEISSSVVVAAFLRVALLIVDDHAQGRLVRCEPSAYLLDLRCLFFQAGREGLNLLLLLGDEGVFLCVRLT